MGFRWLILSVLLALSLHAFQAHADDYPPDVRIESLSSKGSGCPGGTVHWTVAPNASAVSFLFDRYQLQGSSPQLVSQCQFRFLLMYPKNYRLRVVGVDYRGGSVLPAGSTATISTQILQTISKTGRIIDDSKDVLRGPFSDSITISRATTKGDWFSCNGIAGMNYIFTTQMQISNPTGEEALLQLDSADVDIHGGISFRLAWERCH
jgi:hypothetical protein